MTIGMSDIEKKKNDKNESFFENTRTHLDGAWQQIEERPCLANYLRAVTIETCNHAPFLTAQCCLVVALTK